ncbi:MAG TPA: hypothetical protein VFY40_00620 [Blastocatellia bacterium]|nr:hypothetical protein [Blastocatellia bacterium]
MRIETLKTFRGLVETGSLLNAAALNLVSHSPVRWRDKSLEQRFEPPLIAPLP